MPDDFFQMQQRLTTKRPPAPAAPSAKPLTVAQLTRQIEAAIKSGVPAAVSVRGQISNFKPYRGASGHLYFTLKDESACIDCVIWKDAAARLKFKPIDGLEVIAAGRVGVYADKGKYQLYIDSLSPLGQGALELAFQQMRAKLEKEGFFAADRKKPLPAYPLRIVLLTSSKTAALQDMLKVLRRFPWLQLFLYHVPVQGDGAADKIAAAIKRLSNFDVILLSRGGGSLEDLWAFNEEPVARAIAASRIPIITGIGHEVDVTIADLVADHHAHTPTEAAQTVTANWRRVKDVLGQHQTRVRRALSQIVLDARQRLTGIERHELFRRPMDRINALRQLLDDRQRSLALAGSTLLRRQTQAVADLENRWSRRHPRHAVALQRMRIDSVTKSLRRAIVERCQRERTRLDAMENHLRAVGPEQVLKRGFTITIRKKDGLPLKTAQGIKPGEVLVTRWSDGTVESVTKDPRQPTLF
jgi:exodeoxyribonuclease VII large subunit